MTSVFMILYVHTAIQDELESTSEDADEMEVVSDCESTGEDEGSGKRGEVLRLAATKRMKVLLRVQWLGQGGPHALRRQMSITERMSPTTRKDRCS